jgi:hypothetical protein
VELTFDLIPGIMGLLWFIFVISIISRIAKAVKKAGSEQNKGFDQQTVLKRLEELRRSMEEKGLLGEQGKAPAPAPYAEQKPAAYQSNSGQQRQAPAVRRSRFEDNNGQAESEMTSAEGQASPEEYSETVSGSLQGTSSETLKESLERDKYGTASGSLEGTSSETLKESRDKDKYGSLTPFQRELLAKGQSQFGTEGMGTEEGGQWKAAEMCEAWGDDWDEANGGKGSESDLLYLSSIGEPMQLDLVGGITAKDMADAVVWSEIMERPLSKRQSKSYGSRKQH